MAKVKVGLKNVYINAVTVEDSGAVTFGESKKWPGAVSLSAEPQGDPSTFYADDESYYISNPVAYTQLDLEMALVPDWFFSDFLGQQTSKNGTLVESTDDQPNYFALAFEFSTDEKAARYRYFYCKASKPTEEGETKTDSADPKTTTISVTAYGLPDSGIIRDKTTAETSEDAYNSWYTTPALPSF